MALRSPPRLSPGTNVSRNRPCDSTSSVATAFANHTRLRPGSNIVVPIFNPGQAPDAQANPTSGSGPGTREHFGQPERIESRCRNGLCQRHHVLGLQALSRRR